MPRGTPGQCYESKLRGQINCQVDGEHYFKAVHLCCGYPDKLDTDEYLKAPKTNYNLLAPKIDSLGFDEVSIENAEANNDLSLLALFKKTKVSI